MNYNFHGNYSDENRNLFRSSQEEDTIKICNYLKTPRSLVQNIKFEVFDTREGKQNADPNHSISRASTRFDEMAIYRFWLPTDDPHFPHEITHLVAHVWSKPYILETELDTWDNKKIKRNIEMVSTSFMQEGLAIAVDDIIFGRKLVEEGEFKFIDDWCREQLDKMPSLAQCINMDGFGSFDNKLIVPFAASFSKFLLIEYGLEQYKKMYVAVKEVLLPAENIQIIQKIYQASEDLLLKSWIKSLTKTKTGKKYIF